MVECKYPRGYLSADIDAWSVAGGTTAWQRAGHPITRGRAAA